MPLSPSQLRHVILGATQAEIFAFGLYTILFLHTLNVTLRKRDRGTFKPFIIVILCLLYSCALVHCGLTWWYTLKSFANYGSSPDLLPHFVHDQPLFFIVLGFLSFTFSTVIADSISIWRCWAILGNTFWVVIPPILAVIAGFILAAIAIGAQIHVVMNPGEPITFHDKKFTTFSTPYLCLSLGSTLYTTLLIIGRLLYAMVSTYDFSLPFFSSASKTDNDQRGLHLLKPSRSISRAAEIIVESASIYSVLHVASVILLLNKSGKFAYTQNLMPQFAGIAPTLLLLRVSMGYTAPTGWSTGAGGELSTSIRFSTSPGTSTNRSELVPSHRRDRRSFDDASSTEAGSLEPREKDDIQV